MPQAEPRFRFFAARVDRTAAMPFIMATALIDMISIGLIIPVLPALVGSFTGSRADQAFWYGVVTFAFSFANFFGSPFLGALSDSYGRRPVLLIGFSGLALNFFLTGLATSLAMLILVRLVGGAMGPIFRSPTPTSPTSRRPRDARNASACWARCSAWVSSSAR